MRLSQPKFMELLRRMRVCKLRVVLENASGEIELWSKSTSAQVDSQLRERRRGFRRRREALERIQSAAGDLEQRIAEIESQDQRLNQYLVRVNELAAGLRDLPQPEEADELVRLDLPPSDEPVPMLLRHRA